MILDFENLVLDNFDRRLKISPDLNQNMWMSEQWYLKGLTSHEECTMSTYSRLQYNYKIEFLLKELCGLKYIDGNIKQPKFTFHISNLNFNRILIQFHLHHVTKNSHQCTFSFISLMTLDIASCTKSCSLCIPYSTLILLFYALTRWLSDVLDIQC